MEHIELLQNSTREFFDVLATPLTSIEVKKEPNNTIRVNIKAENTAELIGWHGKTLDALQHILKSILWKHGFPEEIFLILDIDEYKKEQEKRIISIAEEKALLVIKTKETQTMPFLNPADRRIIHNIISDKEKYPFLSTKSIDFEDGSRRLQIIYNG